MVTASTKRDAPLDDEESYLEIDHHDVADSGDDDADASDGGVVVRDDDNDEEEEEEEEAKEDDGTCSIVGLPRDRDTVSRDTHVDEGDDEDDDGESIVVTIDSERLNERVKLARLLRADQLATCDVAITANAERDRVQRYVETDLELQREIEMIVRESIRPTTDRCISVLLNNQVIVVPVTIRISDRLASYIWGTPRQYCPRLFPFVEEFDLLLGGLAVTSERRRVFAGVSSENACALPRTFAVFAVRYVRTNCLTANSAVAAVRRQQQQRSCGGWASRGRNIENIALRTTNATPVAYPYSSSPSPSSSSSTTATATATPMTTTTTTTLDCVDRQSNKKRGSIFGLYQYCDFSILVIRDNRVIDYAVHGVHSDIVETIERQRPEVIYYNARPGDALDVFVRYEWQPFYECLRDRAKPVNIYRNTRELFNTLPFCSRSDIFCAFCHALRDARSLVARPWQIACDAPNAGGGGNGGVIDDNADDSRRGTTTTTRYSPYRKTRRSADWRHQARSRRPKRMQSGRFNYNSNCAPFRV